MDTAVDVWVLAVVIAVLGLFALLAYLVRRPTGTPGPPGPTAVSEDVGNYATLGSDKLIFVPTPTGGYDPERPPDTFVLTDFGGRPWDQDFDNADAINRMQDAVTSRGGELFLPGAFWTSRPLVPKADTIIRSLRAPKYAWDDGNVGAGLIARSNFDGPALVWNRDKVRGVTFRNLGVFGPGEDSDVDGFDFGPSNGPERSFILDNCQVMYTKAGLSGFLWVVTMRNSHISRCGWGVAPHLSDQGQGCRANDCNFNDSYVYFNKNGGYWFGGDIESGLTRIVGGRVERSGVSMNPFDPNVNRVPDAPGILLTKATKMMIDVSTDCNSGSGLRLDAETTGQVNNIDVRGIYNRDATYKNKDGERLAAVVLRNVVHCTLNGPMIGFGDPDDFGSGLIAPQMGFEFDGTEFVDGHGHVQLKSNSVTAEYGKIDHGNNWQLTAEITGWT